MPAPKLKMELVEGVDDDGENTFVVEALYIDEDKQLYRETYMVDAPRANAIRNARNQAAVLQALGRPNLKNEMAEQNRARLDTRGRRNPPTRQRLPQE